MVKNHGFSTREEGMSWKGVHGGNLEGEERMRGSALSSPMGVPLGYFREYKKNEEDKRKRNVRAPLSRLPLTLGCPLSFYYSRLNHSQKINKRTQKSRENIAHPLFPPLWVSPLVIFTNKNG